MKVRLKNLLLLNLLLAVVLSLTACGGGETTTAEGTTTGPVASGDESITVASDIAYRPFEFTRGGEPTGFDIDLMREVGERAGYEVEFQNVRFDGIIPGLGNNLYDAAISAMTITDKRKERVDFSDPYFNADQSLLVRGDSDITSVDDIGDATVGVQSGTTGEAKAKELKEDGAITGEVRAFNNIEDAFVALENGQVEAVINDFPVSSERVRTSNEPLKVVETIPTGEQYGIAFPKDSELVDPVNEALAEIKEDGTYAEIYEKWFGQEPEEIP
jgi:ABC-type amino acid transport substrate-binding protein